MPKNICLACQTEYKPATNGVVVIETALMDKERRPYKIWNADLYKCPDCNHEIVSGFANKPMREDHYAEDFADWLAQTIAAAPAVYWVY